jgi:hypothetical protein
LKRILSSSSFFFTPKVGFEVCMSSYKAKLLHRIRLIFYFLNRQDELFVWILFLFFVPCLIEVCVLDFAFSYQLALDIVPYQQFFIQIFRKPSKICKLSIQLGQKLSTVPGLRKWSWL